jgi:DinB superfamily
MLAQHVIAIDPAGDRVYRPAIVATRQSAKLAAWRRQAIRRMKASRAATLAFVARLPTQEISRPRTQDAWSIKDVLAHLLACDAETVRRFQLIARGHAERIQWFESMAHADRFNARSVARARRLGLAAILRRRKRVGADLVRWLERVPVAALRDPAHDYTVVEWLPAPGWSHERDHLSEIKAWWRTQRRASAPRRAGRRAR